MKIRNALVAAATAAIAPSIGRAGSVVIDHSFGHTTSLSGPNFVVPQSAGLTRGGNLFQSLKTLRIAPGESVTFTGAPVIQNVLTRITGGSPASINGTLRNAIPKATFYLISPAGVVFGPSATLDMTGSFVVSTANQVRMADGQIFATSADRNATLTAIPPASFGFLGTKTSAVTIDGSKLATGTNQSILVASGPIKIANRADLETRDGSIELASIGAPTTVKLVANRALTIPKSAILSDINISLSDIVAENGRIAGEAANAEIDQSILDCSNSSTIASAGIAFSLSGSLKLSESILQGYVSSSGRGGSIELHASTIDIAPSSAGRGSGSQLVTNSFGAGNAGDIRITADRVTVDGGTDKSFTTINSSTYGGTGNSGKIFIHASRIDLLNGVAIANSTNSLGIASDIEIVANDFNLIGGGGLATSVNGNASNLAGESNGSVYIHAAHVKVLGKAEISTGTNGPLPAGNVHLKATALTIDGTGSDEFVGIDSSAKEQSTGPAGSIHVETDTLFLKNGGIISDTSGPGSAGAVSVYANAINIASGVISTSTASLGNAGAVKVRAHQLGIDGGGQDGVGIFSLASDTSTGSAGAILVKASEINLVNAATIDCSTFGKGNAGGVTVTADQFNISSGSYVSSSTFGPGDAGGVTVSTDTLGVDPKGSPYFTGLTSQGSIESSGKAGQVLVRAVQSIHVLHGGEISSSAFGTGSGGDVSVAGGNITLDGSQSTGDVVTGVIAESVGNAPAGQVHLVANQTLVLGGGAQISTAAARAGGGNEFISVKDLVVRNGLIKTSAAQSGGNIHIHASRRLVVFPQGQIQANSAGNTPGDNGGNIKIARTALAFLPGVGTDAISANAIKGNGGNIIVLPGLFLEAPGTPSNAIDASSAGGNPGVITVQQPNIDLTGEIVPLSASLDPQHITLAPTCSIRIGADQSSFTLEGGNGLPADPSERTDVLQLAR